MMNFRHTAYDCGGMFPGGDFVEYMIFNEVMNDGKDPFKSDRYDDDDDDDDDRW